MTKIVDIYWERINLIFCLDENIAKEKVFLVNEDLNKKYNLEDYVVGENKIVLNVTNLPDGFMLEPGKYSILVNDEKVMISDFLINILEDKSRIFKYRNDFYSYVVDFEIDDNFILYFNNTFYMKNKKYKKFLQTREGNGIKEKFYIFLKIIILFLLNLLYRIMSIFNIGNKGKALFLYENGDKLPDNLQNLYDNFLENGIKCKYLAIDRFSNKYNVFSYFKELFLIARSNIIILENYTPLLTFLKLKKKVKLVQLWHAGVGFKSVGYARFGLKDSPHPYVSSHRKYDYAFVDREDLIKIYSEVFGISKNKIFPFGMPRLNNYLNDNHINEVCNKLYHLNPAIKKNKIILFAPTYRGNGQSDAYYDFEKIDLDKIYKFCQKNNFLFLIKMHPFIKKHICIPKEYSNIIMDYSNLNVNDLIIVADLLITDYSSCVYEYSFFDRPIIFYRYDKLIYEYKRPMHTLNIFNKKQYEVQSFDECLKILNKHKNIEKCKHLKQKVSRLEKDSCDLIREELYKNIGG